jgi:hypothetical protein
MMGYQLFLCRCWIESAICRYSIQAHISVPLLFLPSLIPPSAIAVAALFVIPGSDSCAGQDELLVHEIDLQQIREVRKGRQFFRDRRADSYEKRVAN